MAAAVARLLISTLLLEVVVAVKHLRVLTMDGPVAPDGRLMSMFLGLLTTLKALVTVILVVVEMARAQALITKVVVVVALPVTAVCALCSTTQMVVKAFGVAAVAAE
jgi:hypothetical protein